MKPLKLNETAECYKYADYAEWDDDNRYELIDGAAYLMSPGPSQMHQRIVGRLFRQLDDFLRGKTCEAFFAPSDVCLNAAGDRDDSVVQPDLFVVCDKSKLDGQRCNGAPDMIIEILSPSSASRDMLLKYNKYLQAGVREYWIADPDTKMIRTCILNAGKYDTTDYFNHNTDEIAVQVLSGCIIDVKDIFTDV